MKYVYFILLFTHIYVVTFGQEVTEKTVAPATVKNLVESQRFEFIAKSAQPLKGRTIFLSPGYTLTVLPDTVKSELPYYGRAYQAAFNPDDAGIKFVSTDFAYTVKDRKNKGWDISIKPRDVKGGFQLYVSIAPNGSASIRITSIDRQSISFSGDIVKTKNE